MASLDYTHSNLISAGKLKATPIEAEKLIPVSKFSRFDSALVVANRYYIVWPTSKPGQLRLLSQDDASVAVLVADGARKALKIAMTVVGEETWIAGLFEDDSGSVKIFRWNVANVADADSARDILVGKNAFYSSSPVERAKSFAFVPGTTRLLVTIAGKSGPLLREIDIKVDHGDFEALQNYPSQSVFSGIVDCTYMPSIERHLILTEDGLLYSWKYEGAGPYLDKINIGTSPLEKPKSVNEHGVVAFGNYVGQLDISPEKTISGFKCLIDLTQTLKNAESQNYKVCEFQRRYIIVADYDAKSFIAIRLSTSNSGLFRSVAAVKLPDTLQQVLDFDLTVNIENESGIAFDAYVYHSRGVAIVKVSKGDLQADGSTVLSALKPQTAANTKRGSGKNTPKENKKNKKKDPQQQQQQRQQANGNTAEGTDLNKLAALVAEKLVQSGKFVTRKAFDETVEALNGQIAGLQRELERSENSHSQTPSQPLSAVRSPVPHLPVAPPTVDAAISGTPPPITATPWARSTSIWAPLGNQYSASPSTSVREDDGSALEASWTSIQNSSNTQAEITFDEGNDSVEGQKAVGSIWGSIGQDASTTDEDEEAISDDGTQAEQVSSDRDEDEAGEQEYKDDGAEDEALQRSLLEPAADVDDERGSPQPVFLSSANTSESNETAKAGTATESSTSAESVPPEQSDFEKNLTKIIQDPTRDNMIAEFSKLDREYDPTEVVASQRVILTTLVMIGLVFRGGKTVRQPTHAKMLNWIVQLLNRLESSDATRPALYALQRDLDDVPGGEMASAKLSQVLG